MFQSPIWCKKRKTGFRGKTNNLFACTRTKTDHTFWWKLLHYIKTFIDCCLVKEVLFQLNEIQLSFPVWILAKLIYLGVQLSLRVAGECNFVDHVILKKTRMHSSRIGTDRGSGLLVVGGGGGGLLTWGCLFTRHLPLGKPPLGQTPLADTSPSWQTPPDKHPRAAPSANSLGADSPSILHPHTRHPRPVDRMNDTCLWRHCLPWFAVGNYR